MQLKTYLLFSTLSTDDERERQAECVSPGTYNVVVNPESFQHLPEYSEESLHRSVVTSPLRRGSLATSMTSSGAKEYTMGGIIRAESGDPNVVILPRFEDSTRRPQTNQWKNGTTAASPKQEPKSEIDGFEGIDSSIPLDPSASLLYQAAEGGQDSNLLQQFRSVVWRQLNQVEADPHETQQTQSLGTEIIEQNAAVFPPVSTYPFAEQWKLVQ